MQRLVLILAVIGVPPAAGAAGAQEKSVKRMVKSVRYNRDVKALSLLAANDQGQRLLEASWKTASPGQKKLFTERFQALFAGLAFPKIRKNFEHLKSMVCSAPKAAGPYQDLPCNVVLLHALKKKEMKVTFRLADRKGWKVVDVKIMGDWMLIGIRDQQIRPLMKKGGWDHLLALMERRLAKIRVKK